MENTAESGPDDDGHDDWLAQPETKAARKAVAKMRDEALLELQRVAAVSSDPKVTAAHSKWLSFQAIMASAILGPEAKVKRD